MTRIPFAAACVLLVAGCAVQDPPGAIYPPAGPLPPTDDFASGPGAACPIASSTGWNAWVNAMPTPGAPPRAASPLIVIGKVTVPTGGYQPRLELERVAESHPIQVFVRLNPNPPAGPATQAVVTHDVRGSWPITAPVGSVTIRCGNQAIARISPVPTAL